MITKKQMKADERFNNKLDRKTIPLVKIMKKRHWRVMTNVIKLDGKDYLMTLREMETEGRKIHYSDMGAKCIKCGDDLFLTDADAGSVREIDRICLRCQKKIKDAIPRKEDETIVCECGIVNKKSQVFCHNCMRMIK